MLKVTLDKFSNFALWHYLFTFLSSHYVNICDFPLQYLVSHGGLCQRITRIRWIFWNRTDLEIMKLAISEFCLLGHLVTGNLPSSTLLTAFYKAELLIELQQINTLQQIHSPKSTKHINSPKAMKVITHLFSMTSWAWKGPKALMWKMLNLP